MVKKLLALVLMTIAIIPAGVPPAEWRDPFGRVNIALEEMGLEEMGITYKSRPDTF